MHFEGNVALKRIYISNFLIFNGLGYFIISYKTNQKQNEAMYKMWQMRKNSVNDFKIDLGVPPIRHTPSGVGCSIVVPAIAPPHAYCVAAATRSISGESPG